MSSSRPEAVRASGLSSSPGFGGRGHRIDLSGLTGGRAIVNANDPESHLRQMLVDTGAYYLLGYTSTESPRDGKFHEITVHVKRRGIEVRARKGYWAFSTEDAARAARPDRPPLSSGMASALASAAAPATGGPSRSVAGSSMSVLPTELAALF